MGMIELLNCIAQLLINNFALFAYREGSRCTKEAFDGEAQPSVDVTLILDRLKLQMFHLQSSVS